jgi:hypothetical protein
MFYLGHDGTRRSGPTGVPMVDPTAKGATGTPFTLDVERGKVIEFARAIQARHPDHLAEDAVIPPTFLTTQLFWEKLSDGSNPWALVQMSEERGMHAEQEYIFHGPPPRAGQRLHAVSTIRDISEKTSRSGHRLIFVKMATEYRDDTGKLVAEAILTGVERHPPEESA